MSEVTIKIDGKECKAQAGDFVLNIARANDIFIPAICYLTRCSPTLACKLCMVETDGKRTYACNTKAKDGMEVVTSTPEIEDERRKIMQVYDINHPLQCGVCDQSGECELQNYTLEMGVYHQEYMIPDTLKGAEDWSYATYDPSLCIVCERCVTVCKDSVGDNALKTVPRGGSDIPAELKEVMPKDVYGIWNKMNKSLIGHVEDDKKCSQCGECIAVCPVGALVSRDFQYTSNAWELQKIPATCTHCSVGCPIHYDVKHTSVEDPDQKIYRVSSEWNYASICRAGRFAYDFENRGVTKDETKFNAAVEAFNKADTIKFNGQITNEEALILQKLKEAKGYKLVAPKTKPFADFMKTYSSVTGNALYNGSKKDMAASDFVVTVGSSIRSDSPVTGYAINNSMKMIKGASLFYFYPAGDAVVETYSKKTSYVINHAALKEEALMYLLVDTFCEKDKLPDSVKNYLAGFWETRKKTVTENVKEKEMVTQTNEEGEEVQVEKEVTKKVQKEIDVQYNTLIDQIGMSEADFENLASAFKGAANPSMAVGFDFYNHPRSANLARLAALIESCSGVKMVVIPPESNSLGIMQICDLDDSAGSYTIGYNLGADFTLCAQGGADLDMPAMNQQEGTTTNLDKRVVPTYTALPYGGYTLNDVAAALGVKKKYTARYTAELPTEKGFKAVAFDTLEFGFNNEGEEIRGYALENVASEKSEYVFEEIQPMNLEAEHIVYERNPSGQFSPFTNKAHQMTTNDKVYVSERFAADNGLEAGVQVELDFGDNKIIRPVEIDRKLKGNYMGVSTFESFDNANKLFGTGYRFKAVTLRKV